MKKDGSKITELACSACGSDNMNSMFAKNEGECCRQFGCFGSMTVMLADNAQKLRDENVPYAQHCKNN